MVSSTESSCWGAPQAAADGDASGTEGATAEADVKGFASAGICVPLVGAKLSNVLLAAVPRSAAAWSSLLHLEHILEGSFLRPDHPCRVSTDAMSLLLTTSKGKGLLPRRPNLALARPVRDPV